MIAWVALAAYLLLAIGTYSVGDPGWSSTGNGAGISNSAGSAGAWIADVLLSLFGYVAYLFPVLLGYRAWALVRGIFEIAGAIMLRKEIDNEWWLVASGVLSVLFGLVVLAAPGAAAVGLIWTVAAFSIITGIALVAFSLRLRKHADHG